MWGCVLAATLLAALPAPARAQQSEADVYVAEAILAYESRQYDEALRLLEEALRQDPENVDGLYYTGLVHVARQRFELAIPPLERARALAPGDLSIAFQLGVVFFTQERYDRAEPLLVQVFAERPRTDSVGYYVGFMRYRKKDYSGALRAFNTGTSSDAGIQQLTRFYAGLALAVLGLPERAAAEVDAALRAQPASALTGPAERLRATLLAARERERRFRAELRFGILYDTNVPVNPEPSHDPTAESVRYRDRHSPAELTAVRLDYTFLRTGPWEATVSYSFFQTINNDLPKFNVQDHLGAVGATWRSSVYDLPFQAGAQYAYDYLTLDNDEFTQRSTAVAYASLVEDQLNLTTAQARLQVKEFSGDSNIAPEERRDAKNWMGGLLHVLRFEGDRHLVRLGYQMDVEDADGRNFKYVGQRVLVGGQYTLPRWDTRLKYDYDVHFRNYTHAHSLLPVVNPASRERADTEQTHVVRIEQPLPRDLTLALEWQASVARSNLPVFSFNRNVYSLTLSWQY